MEILHEGEGAMISDAERAEVSSTMFFLETPTLCTKEQRDIHAWKRHEPHSTIEGFVIYFVEVISEIQ